MSLTVVRSLIAILLVSVLLAGTLPAGYAGHPAVSGASQRRGKNGSPQNQQPGSGQRGQTEPAESKQSGKETPSESKKTSSDSDRRHTVAAADSSESKDRATSELSNEPEARSVAEAPSQSRKRPEPPPFDRPAAGANDRSATGGQSPSNSSQSTTPPQRDSGASRSSSEAADRDASERGRSAEPELRRPADSRNPQRSSDADPADPERGRSQKPVLRKPSDGPEADDQIPGSRSNRTPQADSGAVSNDKDEILRLDATLVNIPILVSDRSGRFVPQLSKRDFILYEDGAQQEVAFFGSEEVPFNVALVLDMSPSVQGSNDHIHDAAIEFVRQLRPTDKVMVVSFDRRVRFLTDLTNNRRTLESAILSTTTGSGTSVYDAVYEVVDRLRSIDGRKALILFSDGEDTTSSRASYDEAVDIVTESDVLVYGLRYPGTGANIRVNPWPRSPIPQIPFPIPWPWPWPRRRRGTFTNYTPAAVNRGGAAAVTSSSQNWPRRGRDFMTDITTAGGGPVYDADQITDLSRLATRMAEELRHVYVVSYYPTNSLSNGGFRTIRVRVKGRDELAVRHRRGYNARDARRGT